MAEAWPLGRRHYLQFLRVSRDAPRSERSWTTELDGKQRYGRGQTHRLFGPYAVVVGSWTTEEPDDLIEGSVAGLGHDLTPEQFATLRSRFSDHNMERLQEGWKAPWWHRQAWLQRSLPLLVRLGVVTTPAYGVHLWRRPSWLRRKTDWVPMQVPHRSWDDIDVRQEP